MISSKTIVTKSKKGIETDLRREFVLASKDEAFVKLCNRCKMDDTILMKYTSKIEKSVCELKNCEHCKGLSNCSNEIEGHVYYPNNYNNNLEFSYRPCKYFKKNKIENNTKFFETPEVLKRASLSELIQENERKSILKYIKEFLSGKTTKGLYLNGSFGSGKSYILSALLNELSLKGYSTINVYYPNLLKKLKNSFNDFSFEDVLDEINNCDVLLLDDIGAESNTLWSRDEVLGNILQYRMDNNKTTFFTSNYTIEELENHFSNIGNNVDKVSARRIIERIKFLTVEESLISENKRK